MPFSRAMFLTQGWNLGHLHYPGKIFYQPSSQEAPSDAML